MCRLNFSNNHRKEVLMKRFTLLASIMALIFVIGITTGCDNRSQLEKDADKAAGDLKKALN